MRQKQCVFCQIVNKQIPAEVVYEDDNSVAFLDRYPRTTGMTIVATRQHYSSFDENIELSTKIFQSAQIVARMIKQALNPLSIDFSVIPSQEVPHFHIRVYPVYEKEVPLVENQPKQTTEQELKEIAEKIRSFKIKSEQEMVEEPKVEEKEESKRSEEEIEWIKRQMGIA